MSDLFYAIAHILNYNCVYFFSTGEYFLTFSRGDKITLVIQKFPKGYLIAVTRRWKVLYFMKPNQKSLKWLCLTTPQVCPDYLLKWDLHNALPSQNSLVFLSCMRLWNVVRKKKLSPPRLDTVLKFLFDKGYQNILNVSLRINFGITCIINEGKWSTYKQNPNDHNLFPNSFFLGKY